MEKLKSLKFKFKWGRLLQIALILFFSFYIVYSGAVKKTFSISFDRETSEDNLFQAGELDLTLNSFQDFSPEITPNDPATAQIKTKNGDDAPFSLVAGIKNFTGDADLCDKLNLKVDWKDDLTIEYNGIIKDFKYSIPSYAGEDPWKFEISLTDDDEGLEKKECKFDIFWEARQLEHNPSSIEGLYDFEIASFTVKSGIWSESAQNLENTIVNDPLDNITPLNAPEGDQAPDVNL